MKIICSKTNLLNGVQIVSKAVPNKTTMSILECILIDCTNNEIKLIANDMELGIETTIEGTIVEKGMIALDARILLEIVRKLPDSDITIETDSELKTKINCEKAKFNIVKQYKLKPIKKLSKLKYYFMKREKDYEHKNNKLYINEFGRFFNSGRRMW